jgi:hypothetical protein
VDVGSYISTRKLGRHFQAQQMQAEELLQCEPEPIVLAYSDAVAQADRHIQIPLDLRGNCRVQHGGLCATYGASKTMRVKRGG